MANKRDIEAGRAFVRLFLKNDMTAALSKSLKSAGASMQSFGRRVTAIGVPIAAVGGAITAGFAGAVKHFAAVGDQLDKISKRTGVASSALAEYGFAAEQSGGSMEDVEKAFKRQAKTIRDLERGLSTATEAFADLGIASSDLQGLSPEKQFDLIAKRIAAIEDPTRRAALAQEVWGRAGTKLLPMLDNLEALKQEARDLGLVPTDQEVENAAKVTDAFNRLKRSVSAAFFNIGASLAEPVLKGLEAVKKIAVTIGKWIRENGALVRTIAAVGVGILAAGSAIVAFGAAITGAGIALSAMGTIVGVIGTGLGLLLSPVGLLSAALIGGITIWGQYTASGQNAVGSITDAFGGLLDIGKETVGGISDALMAGDLQLAGEIGMAGLNEAWMSGLATLMENWGTWITATVEVFAGAMAKIGELWINTKSKISSGILEMAKSEGVVGDLMAKLLGVDLRKADETRMGFQRESLSFMLDEATRQRNEALATGDTDKAAMFEEDRQKALANMQKAGYGLTPEQMKAGDAGDAQNLIEEQRQKANQDLTDAIGSMLSGFKSMTDPELLRKQIEEQRKTRQQLTERAKEQRSQQEQTQPPGEQIEQELPPAFEMPKVQPVFAATYSAAAAQIAGYSGQPEGTEEKIASGIDGLKDAFEANKTVLETIADKTSEQVDKLGQFLAGWKVD